MDISNRQCVAYRINMQKKMIKLKNLILGRFYAACHNAIDLMKYSDDKLLPVDYYSRSIAAKEDVLGLIWLIRIKLK